MNYKVGAKGAIVKKIQQAVKCYPDGIFGRLTEDGLPPEEIRELIHIAHEEGFAVMAHCNGARTAEAAAAAGLAASRCKHHRFAGAAAAAGPAGAAVPRCR